MHLIGLCPDTKTHLNLINILISMYFAGIDLSIAKAYVKQFIGRVGRSGA